MRSLQRLYPRTCAGNTVALHIPNTWMNPQAMYTCVYVVRVGSGIWVWGLLHALRPCAYVHMDVHVCGMHMVSLTFGFGGRNQVCAHGCGCAMPRWLAVPAACFLGHVRWYTYVHLPFRFCPCNTIRLYSLGVPTWVGDSPYLC